ncbi:MAG TPA: hypothetical protein VGX28_12970 [Frankiaceae bacterium]|jgi:hypothetical protein|nr:hypothetical protein [Frankiaceae bacterium]
MNLDYAVTTAPLPLRIGDAGRIDVTVTNPGTVYCAKIVVAVPVGPDAASLANASPTASVDNEAWEAAVPERKARSSDPDQQLATYTFLCSDPTDYAGSYPVTISLAAPVVDTPVGTFAYTVDETSGADKGSVQRYERTWTLTKLTGEFRLDSLVASSPSAPTTPVTEFANGARVRLTWDSNGTSFQLFAKGDPKPVYEGTAATCTLDGIARDTTFVLVATVPDGTGGKLYLYDSLTLTVTDPDLTPRTVAASGAVTAASLAVTGDAAAGGTLTAKGASVGSVAFPSGTSLTGAGTSAAYPRVDVAGGGLWVAAAGDNTAVVGKNFSTHRPAAYFANAAAPDLAGRPMGVVINVRYGSVALLTNGTLVTDSGTGLLTHLATGDGHQVVTTPLSPTRDLYVTGTGTVSGGEGRVTIPEDTAAVLRQAGGEPYLVLVTPTAPCRGLAVTEKSPDAFTVRELDASDGDVPFDWLLVSRLPAGGLPERLPGVGTPEAAAWS